MARVVTAKRPEVDKPYFIFKGYLHGRSFQKRYPRDIYWRLRSSCSHAFKFYDMYSSSLTFSLLDDVDQDYIVVY